MSPFYSSSWLTNPDAFLQAIGYFESITAYIFRPLQGMDPTLKKLIASVITSAIESALITLHVKYDDNILSLCEMFQKPFRQKNLALLQMLEYQAIWLSILQTLALALNFPCSLNQA